MRHRTAALVSTVLAMATATLALPAPASAAAAGVSVQITQLPQTFTVGAGAETVTAVVSSRQQGEACQRVRWSMLLRVRGVNLDQVRVERIENDQEFALQVRTTGDSARLTDAQFDPGSLCPGRTVTATYRVAFDGGQGTASFQVDAFDAANRLLQSASATSQVAGGQRANPDPAGTAPPAADPPAADPSATDPSATDPPAASLDPSPSESDDAGGVAADDQGTGAGDAGPTAAAQDPAAANGRTPSLLGPGLIVGAVLVFLGIGLLLRLRMRSQGPQNQRHLGPTSFYPTQ